LFTGKTNITLAANMDLRCIMPFFFYEGQALHQYHGYGWPLLYYAKKGTDLIGSHGCVRLQEADAKKLYGWAVEYETVVHVF
jgi:hypothetical protein